MRLPMKTKMGIGCLSEMFLGSKYSLHILSSPFVRPFLFLGFGMVITYQRDKSDLAELFFNLTMQYVYVHMQATQNHERWIQKLDMHTQDSH